MNEGTIERKDLAKNEGINQAYFQENPKEKSSGPKTTTKYQFLTRNILMDRGNIGWGLILNVFLNYLIPQIMWFWPNYYINTEYTHGWEYLFYFSLRGITIFVLLAAMYTEPGIILEKNHEGVEGTDVSLN